MGKGFRPDMQARSIFDIDFDLLLQRGLRGLVFDLDNTVVPWHSYDADQTLIDWFSSLQQRGFAVCILSNSHKEKVDLLKAWLTIPIFGGSGKPKKAAFLLAAEALNLPIKQMAMIGDQLLTDIYGGNKAGMFTILTKPLNKEEFWGTRYVARYLERIIKRGWKDEK